MALRERQEYQCLFTGDPNSLKGCPQFVAKKLLQQLEEYNDAPFEELEEEERTIRYVKIAGTIAHGSHVFNQVSFWIASHDNVELLIHLGGSSCWILPDNHYLFFEEIAPELLPKHPSRNTWWVLSRTGRTLSEIEVVSPEEVPDGTWYEGVEKAPED